MRFTVLTITLLLMIGISACSGNNEPVVPDLSADRSVNSSGRQLWGVYDVTINPDTFEASVVPARTAEFRMDVNTFMNTNPGLIKLQITDPSKFMSEGIIKMNVSLTHPVSTKLNLTGFDVHCVLLSNSTYWLNYDDSLSYPEPGFNTILLNPDGWTRWYNSVEFTTPGFFGYTAGILGNLPNPQATMNGYKLYADGLDATSDSAEFLEANQSSRAAFTPGTKNTREWEIQFPLVGGKPFLKYQYAVVASWAKTTVPDPTPADFPPEANIQEASQLRIDTSANTLYYTVDKSGGELVLDIDVFDWQGGNNIMGQVDRVIVESGVIDGSYIDENPALSQAPGSPYATWHAVIPSDHVDSLDDVRVWVAVESASPATYSNGLPTAFPAGKPLTAFAKGIATVSDEAPIEPPELISGVDIVSGTTMCPDRTSDDTAVFGVEVVSTQALTYSWTISIMKSFMGAPPVPGYQNVPGDGNGHLNVDFTATEFQDIAEFLNVTCLISDGINPPIAASPLGIYLDCIIFNASLDNFIGFDNMGWTITDMGTTFGMYWTMNGGIDGGSNLNGTGALWQGDPDLGPGAVNPNAKGMLVSPPIFCPGFLSSAVIIVNHAYSFDPITMGGNIRVGTVGSLTAVTQQYVPITTGQDYDGALTDDTNPMYPQNVFSASGISGQYVSEVNVPPTLLGGPFQIGFAAASGSTGYANGGWLIDNVKLVGTL